MIKLLRKILDSVLQLQEKSKFVGLFRSLIEAVDTFFFGTADITKKSPYIRDIINMKRFMITVVFALLPATAAAVYFFGLRVLVLIFISYFFGLGTEIIFCMVRKHEINEGAFVTCLIYPLILPPTIPYWMAAVGIVAGILFGKEVFGGTGQNIFNPAMVGRIFLAVAFPVEMTSVWLLPKAGWFSGLFTKFAPATITSATPLMTYKTNQALMSYKSLLFGAVPGCVGETAKILIILGGLYLLFTKVANWRVPVAYLGSFTVFSILGHSWQPDIFAPTLFQLLSGGLLLGAFFMATDPVTCPFTTTGKWIFGLSLGFLTLIIRVFTGFVEGVMFALIFMNIFSPLIDEIVLNSRYK